VEIRQTTTTTIRTTTTGNINCYTIRQKKEFGLVHPPIQKDVAFFHPLPSLSLFITLSLSFFLSLSLSHMIPVMSTWPKNRSTYFVHFTPFQEDFLKLMEWKK